MEMVGIYLQAASQCLAWHCPTQAHSMLRLALSEANREGNQLVKARILASLSHVRRIIECVS